MGACLHGRPLRDKRIRVSSPQLAIMPGAGSRLHSPEGSHPLRVVPSAKRWPSLFPPTVQKLSSIMDIPEKESSRKRARSPVKFCKFCSNNPFLKTKIGCNPKISTLLSLVWKSRGLPGLVSYTCQTQFCGEVKYFQYSFMLCNHKYCIYNFGRFYFLINSFSRLLVYLLPLKLIYSFHTKKVSLQTTKN